ncbi:hypothetical protein [Thalassotalea hakodatensis]|uniref:hypothetical protein n=1 Tax=Thalassotalea hakodatensis TaxID=3030492 RepID=UPI0025734546|nr:hypothetical protein [Thalassotalea hakodatensis]
MKRIIISLLLISGCATTSTTNNTELAAKVIPQKMAENCTFVEQFAINKTNLFNSVNSKIQKAQVEAAERAVSKGANSMVIEDTDVTGNGHVVNVSVSTYKCDS